MDDVVTNNGHVIVDQCHHLSAVSFEQVFRQVKARYIAGLNATPQRKDGHHPIIIMQRGSIRSIGEGFVDARLDTLFLAMPISWRGTLQQSVGRLHRLHRLHDNKREVMVYSYVVVPEKRGMGLLG